jgi:hypothetical protein
MMGNMQADDYANGVKEGWASLRQAVAANLQSNHFPPIPLAYVGPVVEAIKYAEGCDGDLSWLDDEIDITAVKDTGMVPRQARDDGDRLYISVATLLAITHSWGFVVDDEPDDSDLDTGD